MLPNLLYRELRRITLYNTCLTQQPIVVKRQILIPDEEPQLTKTRAIRLSDQEDRLIEEFLKKNAFFDFSSLARTAIRAFVENPHLNITPVKKKTPKKRGNASV